MKLTDLRDELSTRAGESEQHAYGDLLPGVRRKVRNTKRNRIAGAVAGVATAAVVAAGLVPNLTGSSTPDPARTPTTQPPQNYTRNGVTFKGLEANGDRLAQASVGKSGQTTVSFRWTPTTRSASLRVVCTASDTINHSASVRFNGVNVLNECVGGAEPGPPQDFPATDALWTNIKPGEPVNVTVELVDATGRRVADPTATLGAAMYTTGSRTASSGPMPSRSPSTSPDDYTRDGIRYRAKIGGDTLIGATVGTRGQQAVTFTFTPTSTDLSFSPFCLADAKHWAHIDLNGKPGFGMSCTGSGSTDAGGGNQTFRPGEGWKELELGRPNTLTVRLTDKNRRSVTDGDARIGLGVYRRGPQHTVQGDGDVVELPKVREFAGYLYELAGVRTAGAGRGASVSISTPAGVPFLVGYGSTATGTSIRVALSGAGTAAAEMSGVDGAGIGLTDQPARASGQATLKVMEGKPAKGKLVLAVYTPLR